MTAQIRHLSVAFERIRSCGKSPLIRGTQLSGKLYLPANGPRAIILLTVRPAFTSGFIAPSRNSSSGRFACRPTTTGTRAVQTAAFKKSDTSMADWRSLINRRRRRPLSGCVRIGRFGSSGIRWATYDAVLSKWSRRLERAICVASGTVHFSDHPWLQTKGCGVLVGAWVVAACGARYLPGRLLGLGPDLQGRLTASGVVGVRRGGVIWPMLELDCPLLT